MTQGTEGKQQSQGLSAREIFKRILAGQVVRIPHDEVLARQLQNHLNVIKSREKKLFASLGLDFTSSTISVKLISLPFHIATGEILDGKPGEAIPVQNVADYSPKYFFEISMSAPKSRKCYPVFALENKNNVATATSGNA